MDLRDLDANAGPGLVLRDRHRPEGGSMTGPRRGRKHSGTAPVPQRAPDRARRPLLPDLRAVCRPLCQRSRVAQGQQYCRICAQPSSSPPAPRRWPPDEESSKNTWLIVVVVVCGAVVGGILALVLSPTRRRARRPPPLLERTGTTRPAHLRPPPRPRHDDDSGHGYRAQRLRADRSGRAATLAACAWSPDGPTTTCTARSRRTV